MSDLRNDRSGPRKRQANGSSRGSLSPAHGADDKTKNSHGIVAKDARDAGTREDANTGWVAVAKGAFYTAVPAWVNMGIMVSLIFGGCCANVRNSSGFGFDMVE